MQSGQIAEDDGAIVRILLNRPESRNGLPPEIRVDKGRPWRDLPQS
jgi:hypothetical protein